MDLEVEFDTIPDAAALTQAADDPANAYESEIDAAGIGVNRVAAPPDGRDQDWSELHPRFAAALLEGGDL